MNNNSIEDIFIDNSSRIKTKKRGKGFLILIFLFFILLIILSVFYMFLKEKNSKTNKELFFDAISNTNIDFYINNDLYTEIINKYTKNNSETETNFKFSNTFEQNEEFENIDISKFTLNLNVINDIENSAIYNEMGISYSDNELLKVKMINNENQFAIFSDEIVNKYVGVNKENINQVISKISSSANTVENQIENIEQAQVESQTENLEQTQEQNQIEVLGQANNENNDSTIVEEKESEEINSLLSVENNFIISKESINLDENTKQQKINEYISIISNKLIEENFSSQDNYVLEKENGEKVDVVSYSLKLTQNEYNELIKELLLKIKNDEDLLNQLVATKEANPELDITGNTNLNPVGTMQDVNLDDYINQVSSNITESLENNIEAQTVENVIVIQAQTNENEQESNDIIDIESELQENAQEENVLDINQVLIAILLDRKIETTVSEIQEMIDYYISSLSNKGNGLEVTVYVSETATEKINCILPNLDTLDIEFDSISENEKNIIITYLTEENLYNDDEIIYSSANNDIPQQDINNSEKKINGFKIDFYKQKNDASTKIETVCSIIEDEKINKEISIDLVTDGTVNSKNFENDLVITYSTNEGELKTTIENKIKFGISPEIETLTEENCLFLDSLPDEELQTTINAIMEKIITVYNMKKENLNFIDTNTQTSLIQPDTITRDETRNLLVTTISNQMGEAQQKGEAYTIQNLEMLQIENHQLSVSIENEVAKITLDGYKFEIDADFNLVDVE